MAFKTNIETPEQERQRLAQAPVGSRMHELSTMPVNIAHVTEGLLIKIDLGPNHTVVVAPLKHHADATAHTHLAQQAEASKPRRRHSGSWDCLIVASNHPHYPVGGYRINLPAYQLARGTQHVIDL